MPQQPPHPILVLAGDACLPAIEVRERAHEYQAVLAQAREQRGHALCTCRTPSLRLVIRQRGDLLHLAAWPDQASQHASACPFYTDPDSYQLAPRSVVTASEQSPDGAQIIYRAALVDPLQPPAPAPFKTKGTEPAVDPASLWPVIHHLWATSSLNRWRRGWRRDYGFVRRALEHASGRMKVDEQILRSILHIPPIYRREHHDNIVAAFERFRDSIADTGGFVLGVVRQLEHRASGHMLHLRHQGSPVYVSHEAAMRLSSLSPFAWTRLSDHQASANASATAGERSPRMLQVVALLHVKRSSLVPDMLAAIDGVMMAVSRDFFPVRNEAEAELAQALVQEQRQFSRPLSYSRRHGDLPSFVLLDALIGGPVEMFAFKSTPAPGQRRLASSAPAVTNEMLQAQRRAAERGAAFWCWRFGAEAMPELPARGLDADYDDPAPQQQGDRSHQPRKEPHA